MNTFLAFVLLHVGWFLTLVLGAALVHKKYNGWDDKRQMYAAITIAILSVVCQYAALNIYHSYPCAIP